MVSPAIARWPRWLRLTIVGAVTAGVITAGWLCYRYFAKPIVLTVAAGSVDGEALSLVSAVAARLTASNAHVRLKVVDSNTSAKASELLAAHKADLAVVLLMAPSRAGGDNLGDLRNTTIGVIGARLTGRR